MWYLRLLDLSILTCSPNISFLARLVSDNSGSLGKLELRASSSPATSKETVSARVQVLVRGYLRVRFDLPSSIDFRDISCFSKLGAHNPYQGSPQRVQSCTIKFYEYDFLLVINCTWSRVLHRFRDIVFDMSNVAIYLATTLAFYPQRSGFPGMIFVTFYTMVNGWLGYKMA